MNEAVSEDEKRNRVLFGKREEIEEKWDIKKKLEIKDEENNITTVKVLGLAATALLSETDLFMSTSSGKGHIPLRNEYLNLANNGTTFYYVLPKQGSFAEQEAIDTDTIVGPFKEGNQRENMNRMRERLKEDVKNFQGRIQAHWTKHNIPYSLVIIYNKNNPKEDSIKVDLYTPYLSSDAERRSFMMLRAESEEDFKFFEKSFDDFWNHSDSKDVSKIKVYWLSWLECFKIKIGPIEMGFKK